MWRFVKTLIGATVFYVLVAQTLSSVAEDVPSAEEAAEIPAQGDPSTVTPQEGVPAQGLPNTGSIYLPFKPPLVVNYGGVGRLKYIKADISVRLQDAKAANSVRHHMPYIRNNLVMLFSAQTEESISSQEGKDALRKEALQEVREVIMAEDRQEGVIDLYFNSFLIQK